MMRNAAPTVPIPIPTLAPVSSPPLVAFSVGTGVVDVGLDELEVTVLLLNSVEVAVADSCGELKVLVVVTGLTEQLHCELK